MIQNLIQIGEPAEHRGIVVTPLFPRRDPVAAYLTLDEALKQGLRIAETSESGSVPELVVENPLAERVLLYDGEELLGAKQNRILNVSVLVEAKSSSRDPGLVRRAGPVVAAVDALPRLVPHLAHGAPAAQGGDAGRPAARPRHCAGRGLGRRARQGAAHVRLVSDRGELGHPPRLRAGHRGRSRARSRRSPASAARSSRSATTCAWTPSPDRTRSRACGRSCERATCSTRSSASTGSPRAATRSARSGAPIDGAEAARQPSAGLGEDLRAQRRAGARLGARARRRADPALGVPQRRRRAAGVRADRAAEPAQLRQTRHQSCLRGPPEERGSART